MSDLIFFSFPRKMDASIPSMATATPTFTETREEYQGQGFRDVMAGLGLSDQKSAARRDHAHRDRRGLFSIHTKYGLLNRLPTKVSFSIFDKVFV